MDYERELEFARGAAAIAGENAIRMRSEGLSTETKPDDSPVTSADRENERRLRGMIEREYPDDGILGEEGTRKDSRSGRRWILDPIDGTRDFVRGNRFWCVLIALEDGDEAVLGVAHFPMLAETYSGARGSGSFHNGKRIQVSQIAQPTQAVVSPNGVWAGKARPGMMEFLSQFWAVRCTGGALDACMLAAGQIDVWFEGKAAVWDLSPLQVIIQEAGGCFFAFDGSRRSDRGSAIACTPALEKITRAFFGI